MKRLVQFLPVAVIALVLPLLPGCGGGGSGSRSAIPATVDITEDAVSLGPGDTHQFIAIATGNAPVTWSLSGCSGAACGTISSAGFYSAPPVISARNTVTVTAMMGASGGDCSAWRCDYAAVNQEPRSVSIAPPAARVSPGGTLSFTAAVTGDAQRAGVTWALGGACGADNCGTLSDVTLNSVTFHAPSSAPPSPSVKLIAASIREPGKSAEAPITVAATRALVEGEYAFSYTGWQIGQGFSMIAVAGHFHADSAGKITNGVEDVNLKSGVLQAVPFTGAYNIGNDGRGTLTLTSAQGTATYAVTGNASGTAGKFIRFDSSFLAGPRLFGTGGFELQDKNAFSLAGMAGSYAMGISGTLQDWARIAIAGRFLAGSNGVFSHGRADATKTAPIAVDPQVWLKNLVLTGAFAAPSSVSGRGTATLTLAPPFESGTYAFAYYVVSANKILLLQTDDRSVRRPALSGELRRQQGPFSAASFNGPTVFSMNGVDRSNFGVALPNATIGLLVPNGSGWVSGVVDDNLYQGARNKAITGSYSVESDGRAPMVLPLAQASNEQVAYFFGPNQAFLLQGTGRGNLLGRIRGQTGGSFNEASLAETLVTATSPPASDSAENATGITTFDGKRGLTSSLEVTNSAGLQHFDFTGTYSVAANGRGTLAYASTPSGHETVFWVISPTELVGIGTFDPADQLSTLVEYEK